MAPGSELLQTAADKLNNEQVPYVRSWRHLAHHLGIPLDVYQEFDRTEPRKSPTMEVMQWLTARSPRITLIDVVKALDKIQRNDAIQIIAKQFPDTVGKYKCHKLKPCCVTLQYDFYIRLRITFTANGKRQKCPRDHVYPTFAARFFQFLRKIE